MEINGEQIIIRDENGKFAEGSIPNPKGRPVETEEQKLQRKVKKEFIAEYKAHLEQALPLISPILIAKAMEGDMQAIKEVNDRVMGKPHQSVAVEGNVGLAITFSNEFNNDEKST